MLTTLRQNPHNRLMEHVDPVDLARVRRLVRSGAARAIRASAGVSLAELAGAVGPSVQPTTVWRWERGERMPRGELAVAYLAVLDRLAAL